MRTHIAAFAGSVLVLAGCGANTPSASDEQAGSATSAFAERGYAASRFAFIIGGTNAGWVQSVEGGGATADVVNERALGRVFAGGSVTVRVPLGQAVLDWVADFVAGRATRKNGAIAVADANLEIHALHEFDGALLTEIGFPACDGSSKDPAYMTLKFAPEYTRYKKASGKLAAADSDAIVGAPSYALALGGLDALSVSNCDALTIAAKEPGKLEVPNLKMTFSEHAVAALAGWHSQFVIEGQNGTDQEKTGALEFLAPTRRGVILVLKGLGSCTLANTDLTCANLTVVPGPAVSADAGQ